MHLRCTQSVTGCITLPAHKLAGQRVNLSKLRLIKNGGRIRQPSNSIIVFVPLISIIATPSSAMETSDALRKMTLSFMLNEKRPPETSTLFPHANSSSISNSTSCCSPTFGISADQVATALPKSVEKATEILPLTLLTSSIFIFIFCHSPKERAQLYCQHPSHPPSTHTSIPPHNNGA